MKSKMMLTSWMLIVLSAHVYAHGDEDHGPKVAAPTTQSQPFVETHSPDFELVLSLSGSQLLLYLDRYADNKPVEGAQIEMDYAGQLFSFKQVNPGEYTALASDLTKPGKYPVSFTVIAGNTSDLLDATLVVPPYSDAPVSSVNNQMWYWVGGGIVAFLLSGGAYLFRRRPSGVKA